MRPLLELEGDKLASELTPRMLLAVRERMVDAVQCGNTVNKRIMIIRRV